MSPYVYIIIMAIVSALIRILPLLLLRHPIKNTFLRSFFHYVPYVTLSVMTFPAIIHATDNPISGVFALVTGMVLAWFGANMITVSSACCMAVFVLELLI